MATDSSAAYLPPFYNFKPFFTRQPNEASWQAQLAQWRTFILAYCRHHKIWRLILVDAMETELFYNKEIQRKLPLPAIREVISSLVSTSNAEWLSPEQSGAYIFWRTPEEFALQIHGWVDGTGQKNTVLTLFELVQGEDTTKQEFYGMDEKMLRKCLDVLVKKGKAQVFSVGDEGGVKFY